MAKRPRQQQPSASEGEEDTVLAALFRRYARAVAARPVLFIVASVAVTLTLTFYGIFVAGLVIDDDPQKIWVPQDSTTAQQQRFFDAAFDPFFRVNQIIVALDGATSDASVAAGRLTTTSPPLPPSPSTLAFLRERRGRLLASLHGPEEDASGAGGFSLDALDALDATTTDDAPPSTADDAAGIITRPYLEALYELQAALIAGVASDGTTLADVCFRPIPGKGCLIETPLDFFRSNLTTIRQLTPGIIQDALSCRHILGQTSIPCLSDIGVPVLPAVVLGGTGCPYAPIPDYNSSVCGGCGTAAQALIITFLLQNTPETTDRAANWEKDVFLPLVSAFQRPGVTTSYMAERSITDELAVVDRQNSYVVVISYAVMLVYIAFALGKFPHPVATRALLGLQGVVIVLLSASTALGITCLLGLHITMIVTEVVPFLLLAIGVDNMFLIAKAIDRRWWGPLGRKAAAAAANDAVLGPLSPRDGGGASEVDVGESIADAAASALAEVGPTITAAAFCEGLAFAVGLTTMVPALQQFCAVAALAVGIDYVLQLTWFLPAVILDARRQEARRADIFPCIRLAGGRVQHTHCSVGLRSCLRGDAAEDEGDGDGEGEGEGDGEWDENATADKGTGEDDGASGGARRLFVNTRRAAGGSPSSPTTFGIPTRAWDIGLEQGFAAGFHALGLRSGGASGGNDAEGGNGGGVSSLNSGRPTRLSASPAFLSAYSRENSGGGGGGGAGFKRGGYDDDDDGGDGGDGAQEAFLAPLSGIRSLGRVKGGRGGRASDRQIAAEAAATLLHGISFDDDAPGASSMSFRGSGRCCGASSHRFWFCVNRGGFVRSFVGRFYAPFIFHPVVRALVILIWLALLALSFYAVTDLKLGLEQQLILPEGSYLKPYFDSQSRLGEAGPPVYVVLQNVNYTHPNASAAIANLTAQLGGLSSYIIAPVYSWVSDFETWEGDSTRLPPALGCPSPLPQDNSTHAARVAQYIYDVHIDSQCCQSGGYCGGQYSIDVKFIWGVPKSGEGAEEHSAAAEATTSFAAPAGSIIDTFLTVDSIGAVTTGITKQGHAVTVHRRPAPVSRSVTRIVAASSSSSSASASGAMTDVDDGGCDLRFGYVSHRDVEAAATAASVPLGSRVRLPSPIASSLLPRSFTSRLSASRRLGGGLGGGLGDLPATLIPCHVMTSRLRTQQIPLRNQGDFIESMQHTQAAVSQLQAAIPVADLTLFGIAGYGPLAPGDTLNSSAHGAISDNEHTAWLPPAPGGAAFPYSLVYVYYDQYGYIRGVVLTMVSISVAAVFMASCLVTSPGVAAATVCLVFSVTAGICGWIWLLNPINKPDPFGEGPYGVDINAVSVVNLVTAVGLSVEFIIHIAAAYARGARAVLQAREEEEEKEADSGRKCRRLACLVLCGCDSLEPAERLRIARYALVHTGSSVVTGITLTKLVGVIILGFAPSQLFRLYYFRMYLGIIVLGAFHGLALLPVLLATFGLPGA